MFQSLGGWRAGGALDRPIFPLRKRQSLVGDEREETPFILART